MNRTTSERPQIYFQWQLWVEYEMSVVDDEGDSLLRLLVRFVTLSTLRYTGI